MDFEEYRGIDAVNISSLLQLARSPRHYRHALDHGGGDTAALAFGRLAHVAVLEPERYEADLALWTGERRYGKAWDAFRAEAAGKVIATRDEHRQALAMATAVREHAVAGAYLNRPGFAEETILWTHSLGLACKSRLDWRIADQDVIVDLKTTRDATEVEFGRAAAKYRYHTRAAFYADAYKAKYGREPGFVLIAVEKTPPYAVAVYAVDEQAIETGRREYERLLADLKLCRETDTWPGPCADKLATLQLPEWVYGADDGLDLEIDGETVHV